MLVGCQPPSFNTYSVTYHGNGSTEGNVEDTALYLEGNAVPVLGQGDLEKPNYIFAGWRTQESQERMVVDRSITVKEEDGTYTYFEGSTFNMPSHNVDLYAQWQLQGFSITYNNIEDATNHVENPATYTSQTPQITLESPTKVGYDFLGWYTASDFSGDMVMTIPTGSTGSKTLFAKWSPSQYTVTFNAQEGNTPNPNTIEVTYGSTYGTLANTSRTGYNFVGWFTGENGSGTKMDATSTVTATTHHSLYAYWETSLIPVEHVSIIGDRIIGNELLAHPDPINATVNYRWQIANSPDGDFTNIPGASSWTYVITPADEGKYLRVITSGTGLYTGTSISNATNRVLYEYEITYNNLENGANHPDNPTTYNTETPQITLDSPSKTGYYFLGWYESDDFSGDIVTTITTGSTGNKILYAKWIPPITVTFNENGGTNLSQISKTVTYDEIYGNLATVEKTGYTFDGWWTGLDGTGDLISEDSIVSSATNQTLYANWVPNNYTITYNDQDGEIEGPTSKTVTYGQAYGELADTIRESYSFAGWWTETGGTGTEITEETIFTETTHQILYAKWTFDVFTGPTGGLVFYENPNWETDGWQYLEAAPSGWYDGGNDPSVQWGAYGYTVEPSARATSIGFGETNSTNINEYHSNLWNIYDTKGDYFTNPEEYNQNNDGTVAAHVCAEYSMVNGESTYDDWFLPSKDELNLMYQNLKLQELGDVTSTSYWSSSEKDGLGAYKQWFTTGNQQNIFRYDSNSIRPIRAY